MEGKNCVGKLLHQLNVCVSVSVVDFFRQIYTYSFNDSFTLCVSWKLKCSVPGEYDVFSLWVMVAAKQGWRKNDVSAATRVITDNQKMKI